MSSNRCKGGGQIIKNSLLLHALIEEHKKEIDDLKHGCLDISFQDENVVKFHIGKTTSKSRITEIKKQLEEGTFKINI
ncbi:MAG: hypothetical protein M1365_12580 [Actinobacteria bacterium]|nr:hypothetical protein [Actinomycetota bacterium]